jgi:16S rRNA U1498 N3-methylase RsmE
MSERFYSPHPITAGCMMLDGPEAHHLLHVMRASVGDSNALRRHREFRATVETLPQTPS